MNEKKALNIENVREILKSIYDPEIPANIVDLGLIYNIEIDPNNNVEITMTLTAMGCPMITEFMEQIKNSIENNIEKVKYVNVNITFDPPWNPSMINKDALLELGITTLPIS